MVKFGIEGDELFDIDLNRFVIFIFTLFSWHVVEEGFEEWVFFPLHDEESKDKQCAGWAFMNQVHLHRGMFSLDGVFAEAVEVKLEEVKSFFTNREVLARADIFLDAMAIVDDVEASDSVVINRSGDIGWDRVGQIDRGLVFPFFAESVAGFEVTPV